MNELIPPQAIELEEAVLGALLLERNAFSLVEGIIKPEYFYKDSHQVIYEAICSLHNKDKPVDMLTVVQELSSMGKLDEAGGAYNVTTMTSKVASAAHIEHHSAVIAEKYERRKIISKALTLAADASNDTVELSKIVTDISELEGNIFNGTTATEMQRADVFIKQSIDSAADRVRRHQSGEVMGIETPIYHLNRLIVGFMPGQLIILAANTGVGKTSVALHFAKHQASLGYKPAFVSLEMPGMALTDRLICADAEVDPMKYRRGELNPIEMDKVTKAGVELSKYDIYISDRPHMNLHQLKASVKQLINKGKCDILYIDYLQLLDGGSSESRQEEIAKISRFLKAMTLEFNIPIVSLAQLNRASDKTVDKRPKLEHLRGSGGLEMDSNMVIFIFKPAKHGLLDDDGNPYNERDVEFIVAKHREGPTGSVMAYVNKAHSIFYDREEQAPQEPEQRITQTDIFTDDSENPFGDFQKEFNTGSVGQNIFPD